MLGRVIVLVRDDQLSLAIGKRGQNVRLASKLVGWDIEVMTREELDEQLERAVQAFSETPGVTPDLAESLVAQGFLSFDDLSVIEPDQLAEMGGLTEEQCETIVAHAEHESERLELEQRQRRAQEKSHPAAGSHHDNDKPESDQHKQRAVERTSRPSDQNGVVAAEGNGAAGEASDSVVGEKGDGVSANDSHGAGHEPNPSVD